MDVNLMMEVKPYKNTSSFMVVEDGHRVAGPYPNQSDAIHEMERISKRSDEHQYLRTSRSDLLFQEPDGIDITQFRQSDRLKRLMNGRTPRIVRTEMESITKRYNDGALLEEEYIEKMAELTAELNLAIATSEMGELDDQQLTIIQEEIDKQFGLANPAIGLISLFLALKDQKVSPAQLEYRSSLYARDAEHVKYALQRAMSPKGHEIRILDSAAENCPDCLHYATLGLRPKGELPLPGEMCQCRANCKCKLLSLTLQEYVDREEEFIANMEMARSRLVKLQAQGKGLGEFTS